MASYHRGGGLFYPVFFSPRRLAKTPPVYYNGVYVLKEYFMPDALSVLSPLNGTAVPLEQTPDPVFSELMLGDGLAVDPSSNILYAPFDAKILNVNKAGHAVVLVSRGIEVLVHVGLETVALKGEGFKVFVKAGDEVKAGQKLLEFDLDMLRKKAASPLVLVVVTSPQGAPVAGKASGAVQTGQTLFSVPFPEEETKAAELPAGSFLQSAPLTVVNLHGLHARPAAVLAKLAAGYPHLIQVAHNGKTADAKSIVALMGLALAFQHQVILRVSGPKEQAAQILAKLEEAFKNGFGENPGGGFTPETADTPEQTDFSRPVPLRGLCACGGLAKGKAFAIQSSTLSFEENAHNPQAESELLEQTLRTLADKLEAQIAAEKNNESRDILNAHLLLVKDPLLTDSARKTILQGKTAAFAFNAAIRRSVDILKKTNNRFLMERIADLKDIRREVLSLLTGAVRKRPDVPQGSIVVAEDLLPSDVSALPEHTAGVLLAAGSPTAHAGILLRNRGIPTLVRAGNAVLQIPPQTEILLDADAAKAVVAPSEQQLKDFDTRVRQSDQAAEAADKTAFEPALTQDGLHILVEGNVSGPAETARAAKSGADGMGLVRTEFLFQGRAFMPTEEEQRSVYQAVLDAAAGRPVTFRTLDAGGDKPLPFVNIAPEENPIVGIRGVRAFAKNQAFFRTQLRALLAVRPLKNVRIMLPMISFTDEVDFFKQLISEEAAALGVKDAVQTGIMVEVPSAALTAGQLAKRADFFSLGTNDLTQYALAIDRGHKELSTRADHLHPAVLKLISFTCQGAQQYKKPVAVCGAMAGDMAAVPLLVGLGITELAVGAGSVARTKNLIRRLNAAECRAGAQHALTLATAQEVRAFVREKFGV